MTTKTAVAGDEPDENGTDVQPVSREAVLRQFPAMVAAVPIAEDDDGSGIIADILQSSDPLAAGAAAGLPEAEDFIGKHLHVQKLSRRESTVADSWTPWYFVVEGTEGPRRTPFIMGTSSQTIMAQLATMHALGQLPALVEVVKSSKATRGGFYPLSLRRPEVR